MTKHNIKKKKYTIFEFSSFDYSLIFFYSKLANLLKNNKDSEVALSWFSIKPLLSFCKYFIQLSIFRTFSADLSLNSFFLNNYYLKSLKIFNNIKNLDDLKNLKVNGINIGTPICQSYHRFFNKKKDKVNFKDKKIIMLINFSLAILERIMHFNKTKKIKRIIFLHDSYIHCRIMISVAKKYKIPVYIIKREQINNTIWLQELNPNKKIFNSTRHYDYSSLKKDFEINNKKQKKNKVLLAKNHIRLRSDKNKFPFKVYLNKKMYFGKINKILKLNKKPKAVILAHNFDDGILRWPNSLFTDYYHWLDFVCRNTKNSKYEFYAKFHPDSDNFNKSIFKEILSKYKNIKILDTSYNLKFFRENNFKFMFTMHGSAVHEFALNNIIPITASDHQASAFNFSIQCKTKSHLKTIIKNLHKINFKINDEEVYQYIYQRYLHDNYEKTNFFSNSYFQNMIKRNKVVKLKYKINNFGYNLNDLRLFFYCKKNIGYKEKSQHMDRYLCKYLKINHLD